MNGQVPSRLRQIAMFGFGVQVKGPCQRNLGLNWVVRRRHTAPVRRRFVPVEPGCEREREEHQKFFM
jgi:hypothetical protein